MLSRYNVSGSGFSLRGASSNGSSARDELMTRLFADFESTLEVGRSGRSPRGGSALRRVQLCDTGEAVQLATDLPGCGPEDIEVTVEGTTLWLSAAAPRVAIPEGFSPLHRERQQVSLRWSVELPYAVDVEKVAATLQQGRLLVTLPKVSAPRPRAIPVVTSA
jgi:HSP20 family protein